jgi:hypothetical protein
MPDFTAVWNTIAEYGPFPIGIIVGMYFAKSAYSSAIKYLNEEKKELREEKKELRNTIEAQQKRIDILHDRVPLPNNGEDTQ